MVDFYWALWFGLRKEVVLGSLILAIRFSGRGTKNKIISGISRRGTKKELISGQEDKMDQQAGKIYY